MKKLLLFSLLAVPFLAPAFAQSNKKMATTGTASANRVKTANGVVEGVLEKSNVYSFKGLPFAAPPVGNLRWREPQPVKNWEGVRKADHFGPRAVQAPIFGDMAFRSD